MHSWCFYLGRWDCKRPGCGNDATAGAAPALCSDSLLGTGESQWWLNMTTAANVSPCGCLPGWSQPHIVRLKRRKTMTAEEQLEPLWCPPGHTESIAPCTPHSHWPQLELSQLLQHEGKHAGKAGPLPTQRAFPKMCKCTSVSHNLYSSVFR